VERDLQLVDELGLNLVQTINTHCHAGDDDDTAMQVRRSAHCIAWQTLYMLQCQVQQQPVAQFAASFCSRANLSKTCHTSTRSFLG
jgi:hypothetical protein